MRVVLSLSSIGRAPAASLVALLVGAVPLVGQTVPAGTEAALPAAAVRLEGRAFGQPASVEIAGLPGDRAEAAGRTAFAELAAAEAALAPEGPLAALATSAGRAVALDPALLELLERALGFCLWSDGRLGPLGGELYAHWGLRRPVPALPIPEVLSRAAESARCDRLQVDRRTGKASLAAGSRIELWGFERGWAVDRAVDRLRRDGVTNARVVVGRVQRGFGPGPRNRGWMVEGLRFPGLAEPLAPVVLRDRALAAATFDDATIEIAGERFAPYVDLRNGKPSHGLVAALAASDLAVDAQGVATAMFVAGSTQGQLLLGSLRPAPAVLWLVGSGVGEPLFEGSRWSTLRPQ